MTINKATIPNHLHFIQMQLKQCCGSGSFYRQAKIARKTLIPTGLWLLYGFLS